MFIINITYIKPIEEIEEQLKAHIEFLDQYYSNGIFIASGRKVPRTGGVILAKTIALDELESILEEDPFKKNKLAVYEITTFIPSKTGQGFANLLESNL